MNKGEKKQDEKGVLSRKIYEQAKQDSCEATADFERLLREVDGQSLFIIAASLLSFAPVNLINESWRGDSAAKVELLAFLVFPHIGKSSVRPTQFQVNECLNLLDKIFASRMQLLLFEDHEQHRTDPLVDMKKKILLYAEYVRGSAYPEQTTEEIHAIQGKFDGYFQGLTGISPSRAVVVLNALVEKQEAKLNFLLPEAIECAQAFEEFWKATAAIPRRSRSAAQESVLSYCRNSKTAAYMGYLRRMTEVLPSTFPISRDELENLQVPPTMEEWDGLAKLIGLNSERIAQYSGPKEIQFTPLYTFPCGRVFLAGLSSTLDALWLAFDHEARKNTSFFDNRYSKTKSSWLEDKTYQSLSRIFPEEAIYRNVSYSDPSKNAFATTELDFLVYWPPFVILVEAKAKQFKEESQLGDVVRLRSDLKSNLEDAFQQARRARAYIESARKVSFTEIVSRRSITLNSTRIRKIYLLSISLHHLSGMATNLASLQDLGLFSGGEYPFATCSADFELISMFSANPDVFLHYIERRLDILHGSIEIMGDEMDLFGAYLESRLQGEKLFGNSRVAPSGLALNGFSAPFDKWMMHKRGEITEQPEIQLKMPSEVLAILNSLRQDIHNEAARWISFALLGFTDRMLLSIDKAIREIRESKLMPGMFRRVTLQEDDVVVTIVATIDQSAGALSERTIFRAVTEKYRRKISKSIGIGIRPDNHRSAIDCAQWIEGPWEYDEALEKALEDEPIPVLVAGEKWPARNEPCFCGSGRKYKKCCRAKVERN